MKKKEKKAKSGVKKPFYKKWWFWVIVVVILAAAFGGNSSGSEEKSDNAENSTVEAEISSEETATAISDESISILDEYEEEETISSVEEDTEAEIGIRDDSITGHGVSDSGWDEPQYVGYIGYVVLRNDSELKKSDTFTETPWTVPVYEQDKQFYNEVDTIEHKTEVLVLGQNLSHEGHGFYSGYLEVETLKTGTQYIVDVNNFITKPYWTYDDLEEAAAVGDYIAEYNQVSDYYPVTKSNEKVELDDGILVLVVGKTGTYGGDGPDNDTNQIEAIVFKQWTYGYGGVSVFFNSSDLTLIY